MRPKLNMLALVWCRARDPQAGGAETNPFEQAERWVGDGYRVVVVYSDNVVTRRRYSVAVRAWTEKFSRESCAEETLEVPHASGARRPYHAIDSRTNLAA